MKLSKFLSPASYRTRLEHEVVKIRHRFGLAVVSAREIEGHLVRFKTASYREYLMRVQESYRAEPSTMTWIREFIGPNDVVYDVGANVGAYSLLIGHNIKKSGGTGVVYAFEPESLNFSSLNTNVVLNGLKETVLPYPVAIGEKLDLAKFYVSRFSQGSATHGLYEPTSDGRRFVPAHVQGILSISLDELVRLEGMRFPNHIKIDVDGLEPRIIQNMKSVLGDQRLKTLVLEITDQPEAAVVAKTVESFGLRPLHSDVWDKPEGKVSNILYGRSTSNS